MSRPRKRRCLRSGLRALLIALTVRCIWLGWRVNQAQKQQRAMEILKAKGAFLYHNQYDAMAIVMHRLTGTWAHGDVWELVLSHDI